MLTFPSPFAPPASRLPDADADADADAGFDHTAAERADLEVALDEYTEQLANDPDASANRLRTRFPQHHVDIDRLAQAATTPLSCEFPDLPPLTSPCVSVPPTRLGRYRLAERIGFGGMGDVYRATDPENPGDLFAAKILRSELRKPRFMQRFEAECQRATQLQHRNIVRTIGSGNECESQSQPLSGQCPYLIMQWINGTDLVSHCREQQLSIPQRLKLFLQVCDGVDWIHHSGLLHRDLKPTNILVSTEQDQPVAKIIDFGLACSIENACSREMSSHESLLHESTYQVLGTLPYMSPERATCKPYEMDVRSDVFSLGVLLFELMTGTVPLWGVLRSDDSIEKQLRIIHQQQPVRPSVRMKTLTGRCPASISMLDSVLVASLANAPANRPSSAQELAQNVQEILCVTENVTPPQEQLDGT